MEPSPDKNERGTPDAVLAWAKGELGIEKFHLDAAASHDLHCADVYYTKEDSGLIQPWFGDVWCNPPFDRIPEFVEKAWDEFNSGRTKSITMLIPANRTEQPFWQKHIEPHRDTYDGVLKTYFYPGRIKFKGFKGSPPFGCVLVTWS